MFISLLEKRRSIRRFLKKEVEKEKIDMLIEAALRSPSSMGRNPWEFVVVTERETLERLSRAKPHGASFLKHAPLGLVICADPNISDVWVEDASIATILILLAAESAGLGACWIQIRERMHDQNRTAGGYISEILGIPENMKVEAIVALGYPDEKKPPHAREGLGLEKVSFGRYGKRPA
jgi:nitroreductase